MGGEAGTAGPDHARLKNVLDRDWSHWGAKTVGDSANNPYSIAFFSGGVWLLTSPEGAIVNSQGREPLRGPNVAAASL